jgi:hypothetical protein
MLSTLCLGLRSLETKRESTCSQGDSPSTNGKEENKKKMQIIYV